jgi:hypothetical protein
VRQLLTSLVARIMKVVRGQSARGRNAGPATESKPSTCGSVVRRRPGPVRDGGWPRTLANRPSGNHR